MEEQAFSRGRLKGGRSLRCLLLLLCLLTGGRAHAQRTPYAALVTAAQGSVNVRRSGGAGFAAAAVKTQLAAGDIVQTGANSRAVLLFSDGSQVKLNGGTLLLIPV